MYHSAAETAVPLLIDTCHLTVSRVDSHDGVLHVLKCVPCPAANLLKPMLARGELRCIGATTLAEYRQHMEKDAAFERRFQQVLVGEPTVQVSLPSDILSHSVRLCDNH